MALKIDSSRPRRNHSALQELVFAIRDCDDPGAEHHAIEWKSTHDLSGLDGQFAVAKNIIGMANRTPDGAARHFGGLGYVAVGVEPGSVEGTAKWDGEKLEPLLVKYLGADGPVWHHDNIDVDGTNVLLITVEPPALGDHIHTLRKTYTSTNGKKSATEGEIFVRRNAATERASTVEIRRLEARLLGNTGPAPLELHVTTKPEPVGCIRLDLSDEAILSMVTKERREVLSTRPKSAGASFLLTGNALDTSTFDEKVNPYLAAWSEAAPHVFRDRVYSLSKKAQAQLMLENPGQEAIEGSKYESHFPLGLNRISTSCTRMCRHDQIPTLIYRKYACHTGTRYCASPPV